MGLGVVAGVAVCDLVEHHLKVPVEDISDLPQREGEVKPETQKEVGIDREENEKELKAQDAEKDHSAITLRVRKKLGPN